MNVEYDDFRTEKARAGEPGDEHHLEFLVEDSHAAG